ncbi:MAG TPA: sigma 54-interacting transcriptional regulator [Kofleriaceae bacterium]|nr:sigma 54-interacting transcriptional regulator [Kofleriaceae bacterium]
MAVSAKSQGPGESDDLPTTIRGTSPCLLDALTTLLSVADTDCTVLINGESGTGKELFARALHAASARASGPFAAINCSAIPESMMEAELFGHVRGSFTGAIGTRSGRLAAADGGTLFLDEIGDMPLAAQAKLLRVLQEGTITPVGSDTDASIDVRVVAATHRDLEQMVAEGKFRADLYFRLNVVPIQLPTLRARGADDILDLAGYFAAEAAQKHRRPAAELDADARTALIEYPWPGNVRELAHKIERAVLLARGAVITPADLNLGRPLHRSRAVTTPPELRVISGQGDLDLKKALDRVEKQFIEKALERTKGNRTEAAALLGLNRTTLVEKLRKIAS